MNTGRSVCGGLKKTSIFNHLHLVVFVSAICVSASCDAAGLVAAWGDNTYGQCQIPNGLKNVKAVAAGYYHSIALKSDGTVVAWGDNTYGQSSVPPSLAGVVAIAANGYYNVALKADGTVVAWGYNDFGQTDVPAGLSNVIAISAGGAHSMELKADGSVAVWGVDYFGVTNVPPGLPDVIAIAAGGAHNLALRSDGTLIAWGGANNNGENNVPLGLSNVTAIAAGEAHNLALKADGTVVAWGYAEQGQTNVPPGLSNVVAIAAGTYQSLALKADGTAVIWGLDGWAVANPPSLKNVTALAGGYTHALALVSDGPIQILQNPVSQAVPYTSNVTFSVVATGQEPMGYQWLLNGQPVVASDRIAGIASNTLAISNAQLADAGDYTVLVTNAFGSVLSSNATLLVISPPFITGQSSSQSVRAGTDVSLWVAAEGTPLMSFQWLFNGTNLPGATDATLLLGNAQPAASGLYSLLISNAYGGIQSADILLTVNNSSPFIIRQPVGQIAPLGGTATISVSARGSLPLNYQWRFNGADLSGATNAALILGNLTYGQTGYYSVAIGNAFGATNSAKAFLSVVQTFVWGDSYGGLAPTNIPFGLTNAIAVAVGDRQVVALRADGTVVTWANNSFPPSWTNVPAGLSNVIAVAAGGGTSLALRTGGAVLAWGDNIYGKTNVPLGLSNVVAISASRTCCLALKPDGVVSAWGLSSQTNIPASASNVVAVAAGEYQCLALRCDGKVVTWGQNAAFPPPGLSNVIAIAAGGGNSSMALKRDGTVVTWGTQNGSVPQGLSNVVAIAAGTRNLALKADGSVVAWGSGPTAIPSGLANVFAVAAGAANPPVSVALVGNGSPAITIQPFSQVTAKGNTVQFHARAVGIQPMTFQWQLNGENLPGATNADLTIANIQGSATGDYQMVAANMLGVISSGIARLTVPFSTNLAASLNATNLVWDTWSVTNPPPAQFPQTRPASTWAAQIRETHDGNAAAQSGLIKDNQQSVLQTTITGPGTLTFWWKVSSEEGFDFLKFYLDELIVFPKTSISGETDWQQQSFAISSGTHTVRWSYAKDGSVSDGRDAGWVDEVTFTPPPPLIFAQPQNLTVSKGSYASFNVGVNGTGPFSFQWLRGGTNLIGATNGSLSLSNVRLADAGVYAARVTNAGGSMLSSNATLSVRVSPQKLSAPALLPDGSFVLTSRNADNTPVRLADLFDAQASTNLVDWITLTNVLTWANGSMRLTDPNAASFPRRFYRVMER